eukprot:Pgem_evm2s19603
MNNDYEKHNTGTLDTIKVEDLTNKFTLSGNNMRITGPEVIVSGNLKVDGSIIQKKKSHSVTHTIKGKDFKPNTNTFYSPPGLNTKNYDACLQGWNINYDIYELNKQRFQLELMDDGLGNWMIKVQLPANGDWECFVRKKLI